MKKKLINGTSYNRKWLNVITLKMKLLTLFIFAGTMALTASTYSQQTKIDLRLENSSVIEVLNTIERNTEFIFIYNGNLLNSDAQKSISISVKDQKIEKVLDQIFQGMDVAYRIDDRQVFLYKKDEQRKLESIDSRIETEQPQKKEISGTVKDSKGIPLPGVNVVLKGTTTGTITDNDGQFRLLVPLDAKILVFSFVGLKSQEATIDQKGKFAVVLEEDKVGLDEVVAVGYGTVKRRDMVGSVGKILSKDLVNPTYSNVSSMLQGKVSGVYGSNGGIRIRGINSISLGTEPLWVVDGVIGGGAPNPNDIVSIDIQKDAVANAIFGSRASNGVILVTTKAGSSEKNNLSVNITSGVNSFVSDGVKLANTSTYFDVMDKSLANDAKYRGATALLYSPMAPVNYKGVWGYSTDENNVARDWTWFTRENALNINTDHLKAVKQNGTYLDLNISTSQRFNKGNMFFSFNYRGDKGDVKGYEGKKLEGRFAINIEPVKNLKLAITTTINYNKNVNGADIGYWADLPPFFPVYNEKDPSGYFVPVRTIGNILATSDKNLRDSWSEGVGSLGNFSTEYALPFVKGLSVKATVAYTYGGNESSEWDSKFMKADKARLGVSPSAYNNTNKGYSTLYNAIINYDKVFGNHILKLTVGKEGQKVWSRYVNANGENLAGSFHELGTPGIQYSSAGLTGEKNSLGYFGRLNYKFKDRYLLTGSFRRDAVSDFDPNNQWATFMALGAGWIISDESFFKLKDVNLLKIRGSFGQTGNGYVPQYIYLNKYNAGRGYRQEQYSYIQNIGNPDAKWETTNNYDLGVDFGLLDNRINGSLAYYIKSTKSLLLQVPLPYSAGIPGGNFIWQNIGNMSNKGIEFNISYNAINSKDFTWQISFNNTFNKNEISSLYPTIDATGFGLISGWNITKKGEKLASYYLADFAGIDPTKGIPMIYERDATVYAETGKTIRTGKLIPMTSTNASNNLFIQSGKSGMPDWYGGLTNSFTYKNFDLDFQFTYTGGLYVVNSDLRFGQAKSGAGGYAMFADILSNSWQKPGDIAKYPEPIYNGGFYYDDKGESTVSKSTEWDQPTTQDLIKGDLLRLRFVSFGYTFRGEKAEKLGLLDARVFATINNALTFSKIPSYLNPEAGIPGNLSSNAVSVQGSLPPVRTFSLGIKLNF